MVHVGLLRRLRVAAIRSLAASLLYRRPTAGRDEAKATARPARKGGEKGN
jgi:hypothetical protein